MSLRNFIWWFSILFFLIGSAQVAAAQDDLFAGEAAASYTFGQSVRFDLVGKTAVPLQSATLVFQAAEFISPFSADVPVAAENEFELFHVVDLGQIRLAPFTTVSYWWLLTTEDGAKIRVPAQTFFYEDDQFSWHTRVDGPVEVHWTGNDAELGDVALAIVQESHQAIEQVMPMREGVPVRVYIYPSSADLRSALRLNGLDWQGNRAHPALGVVLVTAVNSRTAVSDLQQSIPDALTRFWLHQLSGTQYDGLPFWLREGLAVTMEPVPDPIYKTVLETAVATRSTIPISDLCADFSGSTSERNLAISQSADFIHYLQSRYGNQLLHELVAAYAEGATCEQGVDQVLGKSLASLDQDWLQTRQSRPPLVQFFVDNSIWFLLFLCTLFLMGLMIWKV